MVTTLTGSSSTALSGSHNGDLASATFSMLWGIALAPDGTVVVTDGHSIRGSLGGEVFTIAGSTNGSDDGPAASARFLGPAGVAVTHDGWIYVADTSNNRIRVIHDGVVQTLAGTGAAGYRDGPAAEARFNGPAGLTIGPSGDIYVADSSNQRIRRIYRTEGPMPNRGWAVVLALAGLCACSDNSGTTSDGGGNGKVGDPCTVVGAGGSSNQIDVNSGDCQTTGCLYYGAGVGNPQPLCTQVCSADVDCPAGTNAFPGGFGCGVPFQSGTFACCKMCICKDYLANGTPPNPSYCASITPSCPP